MSDHQVSRDSVPEWVLGHAPRDATAVRNPSNTKLFLTALGITELFWALAGVALMLVTQPLDQALHYWWVFQIACLAIGAVSQTAIWMAMGRES